MNQQLFVQFSFYHMMDSHPFPKMILWLAGDQWHPWCPHWQLCWERMQKWGYRTAVLRKMTSPNKSWVPVDPSRRGFMDGNLIFSHGESNSTSNWRISMDCMGTMVWFCLLICFLKSPLMGKCAKHETTGDNIWHLEINLDHKPRHLGSVVNICHSD